MRDTLGRGINLGNALEAPRGVDWGVKLKAEYFGKIKAAGFNNVRIPVRWSAYAAAEAPYTIEPEFFARVDWVVNQNAEEPPRARAQHAPLRGNLQGPRRPSLRVSRPCGGRLPSTIERFRRS